MEQAQIKSFNQFRSLCLLNAEQTLTAAESLIGKDINHLVFHLTVLSLEEIGKTFVGWLKINEKDEWGKELINHKIDDHVKKLFWVIWWPTLLKRKITKRDVDKIQNLASSIHHKRLDSLYTQQGDIIPGSKKITNEEVQIYLTLAKDRLGYAQEFGEPKENTDGKEAELAWFDSICDDPRKQDFIFSEQSLTRLEQLGNSKEWIQWLRVTFEEETKQLHKLLTEELGKANKKSDEAPLKWKIRITIVSPSHSIRNNILKEFNTKNTFFQLSKGRDVHTLVMDTFLTSNTSIENLWSDGWSSSQLFVAALNVGSNGLFYWHVPVDTDKYYETIWDLENKKQLLAKASPELKFNWSEKKMFLDKIHLELTVKAFYYFASCLDKDLFEPISLYILGLGLMAKNDIHMRVERQCFMYFFLCFRKALMLNQKYGENFDIKELGFNQIGRVLRQRAEFDKMMELGLKLIADSNSEVPVTLTNAMAMKLYCNYYLMTLAVRKIEKNEDIFLTQID